MLSLSVSSCAGINARRRFGAGKKAEQSGDYKVAIEEYEAALEAQPKNAEYQSALAAARSAGRTKHVEAARAAEAREDWAAARDAWRAALDLAPSDAELKARLELATLKEKRSEPLERYQATKHLKDALPNDPGVDKALAESRDEVLRYYSRIGESYADANAYTPAFEAFEKARQVDPENPLFKGMRFRLIRARHFEAVGDAKLRAGDHLAAFRAYEEAAAAQDLPELGPKMKRAKRAAGALIEQLEQARGYERDKQWEDAAELYSLIKDRPDAPSDVAAAAQRTRLESAKVRVSRAESFLNGGSLEKAHAALVLALEHTDAPSAVIADLKLTLDAIAAGDPASGKERIDRAAKAAPDLPIVRATQSLIVASAKIRFEEAKARAVPDPAGAMTLVVKLAPFEPELKGYAQAKKGMIKGAFKALLDRASTAAAEGRDKDAVDALRTALDISSPPPALARPLRAGADALDRGDYGIAEASFAEAEAADGRSQLARTGRALALSRRITELEKEAQTAADVEDSVRAASAYREILRLRPDHAGAKAGVEALKSQLVERSIQSARAAEKAGRPGSAFVWWRRVLDMDPTHADATAAINALKGSFDTARAPVAIVAPVSRGASLGESCPGAETEVRDALVLYLTRTRNLGAEYLSREDTLAADKGDKPKPPIELVATVESCAVAADSGSAAVSFQLRIGGQSVGQDKVTGKLDLAGIPKDELQDGLKPKKVQRMVLNDAAKALALVLPKHSARLSEWRAVEAQARIKAGDDEGAARVYASMKLAAGKPNEREQAILRELEQYLLNRFR